MAGNTQFTATALAARAAAQVGARAAAHAAAVTAALAISVAAVTAALAQNATATATTTGTATAAAEAAVTERLRDISEQGRFVPERALAETLKLQQAHANPPPSPRLRAAFQLQMADSYMRLGDPAQALAFAEQVIADGKRLGDNIIIAKAQLTKSYALSARAEMAAAHRLALATEKLAMSTTDAALRTQATITAGQTYAEQGDFPAALVKLQQALDLSRTVKDDPSMPAAALNALAKLYSQMKDNDKAAEVVDELLAETAKLNSPGRMAMARNTEYGLAIDTGQMDRALRALLVSLELERKMGAERMVGITLVNLADLYLKRRDFPRAAQYAQEALRSARATSDDSTSAVARVNLGQALLAMGRIAEGKQHYEAGMVRIEQENNMPDLQAVLHEYGAALEHAGDLAGALAAYHRERALSEQMFKAERQKAVLELQEKYETEKKGRQIELLSRENQLKSAEIDNRRLQQRIWWLLAAVFSLGAVVVGLLYRKVRQSNTRLREKNLELKAQSTLDPLTSLYNRRHFHDFMRTMAPAGAPPLATVEQRQPPGEDLVGALFLLDVDHFKHINDTYGHAAGDVVLKAISANLRVALRETDMIVRWGGEEFLAYLPALPRHGLDEVARRILTGMSSQPVRYQEHDIAVNVSVGFAPFPLAPGGVPMPWERAVNLVDMALYLAKSHGRNRAYGVRGFANLERTTMEAIEQDLERAWREGYVELSVVQGDGADAR